MDHPYLGGVIFLEIKIYGGHKKKNYEKRTSKINTRKFSATFCYPKMITMGFFCPNDFLLKIKVCVNNILICIIYNYETVSHKMIKNDKISSKVIH